MIRIECTTCRRTPARWTERCTGCGELGTLKVVTPSQSDLEVETSAPRLVAVPPIAEQRERPTDDTRGGSVPISICDVLTETFQRDLTNVGPLDAVLGGGMVVGSVIVIGGAPGSAKSTLVQQAMAGCGMRTLYATGEETVAQATDRARRVDALARPVLIVAERRLEVVLGHATATRAQLLVIDSIQTLISEEFGGQPGSPVQVKGCTDKLVAWCKERDVTLIMIGHVTRDSALAGPRTLEHLVDVVLMLEVGDVVGNHEADEAIVEQARKVCQHWVSVGRDAFNHGELEQHDRSVEMMDELAEMCAVADKPKDKDKPQQIRILRVEGKNRFGLTTITGRFELTGTGLVPL